MRISLVSMRIFSFVAQDWAANQQNPKGRIVLIAFRVANLCARIPKPFQYLVLPYVIFYRVIVEWLMCIELPWKLQVGRGLRVYHGQALVVSDRARIGENCILRNGTTIGVATTDESYGGRAPFIGNNVDVGANSILIGAIEVGDNSCVGAGSVVISDVPPNSVVVGNPARVVKRQDSACEMRAL